MARVLSLRRALALSSSLLKDRHFSSISSSSHHLCPAKLCSPVVGDPYLRAYSLIQAQFFRSSAVFNRERRFDQNQPEIGPDEILFEGCDYNHWLITVDFPKDPAPTREEMIETYIQTAAKVFGSVEEAKKKIYACSTTTYQGFQCICDEPTSEKFRDLPGVVFILPDSYIDPVNKEYGGDKYENGVITPRPPPIQYGRQGRYGDRNRNYDQPRYNRDSVPPPQDGRGFGPPPQDRRGFEAPPQDGRGFGPPPQDGRGFGPPRQDGRGFGAPPQDGRGFGASPQDGRGFGPPHQDGRGFGPPPQDGRGFGAPPQDGRGFGPPPQDGRGFGPPHQDGRGFGPPPQDVRGIGTPPQDGRGFGPPNQDGRGFVPRPHDGRGFGTAPQDGRGYVPPPRDGRGFSQGEQRDQMPPYQSGFHQGQPGNLPPSEQRNFSQGPGYSGEYMQGPGFNRGSSSAGPVEGQWQAKH